MSDARASQLDGMEHASRIALAIAVSGAALAIGAVHAITLCAVTLLVAIAACFAWWDTESFSPRSATTLVLWCACGLTLYTAFQCLPMPMRLLRIIAPGNADVWSRALAPLHEPGPTWAPVTLDPPATHVELLKGVAYALAFVTALRIARRRDGIGFLVTVVVLTGVTVAVAAIIHSIFGATRVFGVYSPSSPRVPGEHIAPLLNPNHLAAYLNISFCLALGAWLSPDPKIPKTILAALIVFLCATQVWVASRGGVMTMVLAGIVLIVFVRAGQFGNDQSHGWRSTLVGAGMLLGVGMLVLLGFERAKVELSDTSLSKFSDMAGALRMIPTYGIFGIGRGAFETTYPQFRRGITHTTVTHPENIIAQWVTEWGVFVALAGFVVLIWALRPAVALARQRSAAGAWTALVAAAAHNMADFNSEIPGVMLALTVCAAIVVGGSPGRRTRWTINMRSRPGRFAGGVAIASAILAFALVSTGLRGDAFDDRLLLHDAAVDHRPLSEFHDLVRSAILRHPGEPYLPFSAALRATQTHDESPLPWLGATLERAPHAYGPAHLLLAQWLATASPSQARLEYRLAVEQAPELEQAVKQQGPRLVGSYDDAMELIPGGSKGIPVLTAIIDAIAARLPSTAVRLDAELTARAPATPDPHRRAAFAAIQDLTSGDAAPWCEGSFQENCLSAALAQAGQVQMLSPRLCIGHVLRARILLAGGDAKQALDELEHVSDDVNNGLSCDHDLFLVAQDAHDIPRALAALDRIARLSREVTADWIQDLLFVARWEENYGNVPEALAAYKKAYERAPDDDELLTQIARLASSAGLHAEAVADYEQLARHQPGEPKWQKLAHEERGAFITDR
jgi:tetratricopeptide (TPR) repeat protein